MAEREVILDRIGGIQPPERIRDVARHAPAGARVAGELKAPAHADHMGVERHDQLRR